MPDRKLVTIRTVGAIEPIEGADRIEKVRIDGWSVVSQRGTFKVGDFCIYFEPDAMIPDTLFDKLPFLIKDAKLWKGRKWVRMRVRKFKGVISSGLAVPITELFNVIDKNGELWLNVPE